ncbi:MAG TPA: haloacid dehalogenase-like hydrolase [Anaerolineales bacterium]|jgi:phosphoserine phosphatase|nr:haloacid dehalogenase-like hydrolase [Anaerolineales bacterium]
MIVVSDMMGTLTTGSPVLGLVDWVRHNQSKMQARLYMLSIMPSYLIAKRGWIDWQTWAQGLMVNSLKMIKQASPEKMKLVGEWAVEHDLWKKRREDVIARLREHAAQGAQVYIASSVVEPIIEPFAKRVGAQTIGTPVKYADGKVRVAGELAAQERKIEQVLSRLGVSRVDFAYGDTAQDVPLLEHADHPVAVYPDEALKAVALARGWEILGSREQDR